MGNIRVIYIYIYIGVTLGVYWGNIRVLYRGYTRKEHGNYRDSKLYIGVYNGKESGNFCNQLGDRGVSYQ